MTKKFVLAAFGLALLMGFLGCSNSVKTDPDQAAILRLIDSNRDMTSHEVLSSSDNTLSKVAVDTIKLWWRQLLHRGRIIGWGVRQPADSTHPFPSITVTLVDSLEGILHIVGKDSTDSAHLKKPFVEVATRRLFFEKRAPDGAPWRGWVLSGVSGIELVSVPNTAAINWVTIQSGSFSQTVPAESILAITLRPDLPAFNHGDSVHVTVHTGDPADSVYLHAHLQVVGLPSHRRKKLTNNGDGSFSGYVIIPSDANFKGRWHLSFDVLKGHVLSSNDLNDYDSRQWGLLYRVGVPD